VNNTERDKKGGFFNAKENNLLLPLANKRTARETEKQEEPRKIEKQEKPQTSMCKVSFLRFKQPLLNKVKIIL
jgi:hypothetical protein